MLEEKDETIAWLFEWRNRNRNIDVYTRISHPNGIFYSTIEQ